MIQGITLWIIFSKETLQKLSHSRSINCHVIFAFINLIINLIIKFIFTCRLNRTQRRLITKQIPVQVDVCCQGYENISGICTKGNEIRCKIRKVSKFLVWSKYIRFSYQNMYNPSSIYRWESSIKCTS